MISKLTPAQVLSARAGIEIDVWAFENIFGGLIDGFRPDQIPSFSRRADAAKMLMIKMMMENPDESITIRFGDFWDRAQKVGMVVGDKPIKMWKVALGSDDGFGKSFEEAVTKLAVLLHGRERA